MAASTSTSGSSRIIDTHRLIEDHCNVEQCLQMQQDELLVLESIYPDYVITQYSALDESNQDTGTSLRLEIPVQFDSAREIHLVDDPASPQLHALSQAPKEILRLMTLPPLLFHFLLPTSYPLRGPPRILSISTSQSWLIETNIVGDSLLRLWARLRARGEEEGVLCAWIEHVQSGEFLLERDDDLIRLMHPAPMQLKMHLEAHALHVASSKFSSQSFTCALCFTQQPGSKCIQLHPSSSSYSSSSSSSFSAGLSSSMDSLPEHVFCRTCLEDFWSFLIKEGDVGRVTCPDPECVKKGVEATEDEVRRVVKDDQIRRWRYVKEMRAVEKDPTIILCPLSFCQRPVPKPPCDDENSAWARLRTCEACSFSFCAFCKRTWHGPVAHCPIAMTETFITNYLSSAEGSIERQRIEKQYGRANIMKLVHKYNEHLANKKWMEESTMSCPGCEMRFEKSVGCNHMTCNKCGQHFCFRCGERLQAKNPYKHFSMPGHSCYNKLFDIEMLDSEWQPVEGFDLL